MTKTIAQPRPTRVERLAALFRAHPNTWFDGWQDIAPVGGRYAWRTRLSELREPPFNMVIKNRQRRVRVGDRAIVISEYAYVPDGHSEPVLEPCWELVP